MHRRFRIGLNIVLSLVVAAGIIALLCQQVHWALNESSQEKASQTAQFTPPPVTISPVETAEAAPVQSVESSLVVQALAELDLTALQEVNPDVMGWIYIPGTEISYPILQGADNDYYLKHTWEKKWNSGGSIFLDWRCSRELIDFNTLIYGHQMKNGTMFASLHSYKDSDFLQEHPIIYVVKNNDIFSYEIFSVWEPSITSIVYTTGIGTGEEQQRFIDLCLESSQIDTGVVPSPEDNLLTLSTCTGNGHETRWVVQARLLQVHDRTVDLS